MVSMGGKPTSRRACCTAVQHPVCVLALPALCPIRIQEAPSPSCRCWGFGPFPGSGYKYEPTKMEGGPARWSAISAGSSHACGLDAATGTAYCVGMNLNRLLGTAAGDDSLTVPVAVPGSEGWAAIQVGEGHVCGIRKADSAALCFGDNTSAQLGTPGTAAGGEAAGYVPAVVEGNGRWQALAPGPQYTCGIAF